VCDCTRLPLLSLLSLSLSSSLNWQCLRSFLQTGEIVALKKVALRRLEDGIPNQALREIKALQEIRGQSVCEWGLGSVGNSREEQVLRHHFLLLLHSTTSSCLLFTHTHSAHSSASLPLIYAFLFFFFGWYWGLGFELRASQLLGRPVYLQSLHQPLFVVDIFERRPCFFVLGLTLRFF
jgi:hypothetical protein